MKTAKCRLAKKQKLQKQPWKFTLRMAVKLVEKGRWTIRKLYCALPHLENSDSRRMMVLPVLAWQREKPAS